ncbi:hypothetical protein ACFL6K_03545 [Candidatus Latescibacterota bacterium]
MLFSVSVFSNAETTLRYSSPLSSSYYQRGKEAALNDEHAGLSFVTGYAFGFTMPFVSAGAGALVFRSGKKDDLSDTITGITALGTAYLWSTTGSRLNWKRRFISPDLYTEGFPPEGRLEFESVYKETVQERRKAFYKAGFIVGVLTPVVILLHAIASMEMGN